MSGRRPVSRRPLPTWVTALVLIVVVALVGVLFWFRSRGPGSTEAKKTPEFLRLQQEWQERIRQHPELMRRGGGQPPSQPAGQGAPVASR